MAVAVKTKILYTPEEYLALEEAAEYKSEYYNGEIFPMTGGSINHNRIAGNIYALLHAGLRSGACEVFTSDMRVWVKAHNMYTYPDVVIICGRPEFAKSRNDTIANPVVIVEVLSPSTQDYDRGKKFQFYRSILTLRDYLLIHQDSIHVEHHAKMADGRWVLNESQDPEGDIAIQSLNLELPIRRLYERVDWSITE
jgi:Uma2 family endonuclease